ncbi:MAG: GH92 family glycosyl hydrolase [Melioribacteraceae bacterium]|nr:GH92 family glycosyl hydrolase [Melioribacteraceae bacterium]
MLRRFSIKFYLIIILLCIFSNYTLAQIESSGDLTKWVEPRIGTDSEFQLSNGNTYPAIALPWGMNFWTPYTGKMGDGWMYSYDKYKIRGFRQTHQPSAWINDYGTFSIMPVVGELKYDQESRMSWFSHKRETVNPGYYKVYLADYDTWVELTPTERSAIFRISFPADKDQYLVVDAFTKGSMVKISPDNKKVTGYCRYNSGGVPENFHNYFVMEFDTEVELASTWDDNGLYEGELSREGEHVGAVIKFQGNKKREIIVKVSSSFISYKQAELNLAREIGDESFCSIKKKANEAWNKELGRIKVESRTEKELVNFYTALYRLLLFPRKFYEINAKDEVIHYSPYNGKVLPGYMFTDNGFWDTFRAVFPFYTLMYPDLNSKIMQGLANTYKESGWLPEWASPGHRDCMIGSNSSVNIGDSYLKGISDYDMEVLYEAMLKNYENEGPLNSVGRKGAHYYNELGYIPYDVGINENVARTLEYTLADFNLMKVAEKLGKPQSEIGRFKKSCMNYKNVFDKSTNFMRGKNEDGSWQSPFVPEKWGDAFTEGSSWHYTWSVFHDFAGLIDLMGGYDRFNAKLDSVFTAPPKFDYSYYGQQIHEITEMLIAGMGQYAHGNQPIQHGIYLYNYSGQPWKAQQRAREVMDILYTPTPDGLCGDEDNGQTSAWYVFSAIGFYPVCPGTDEYVLGSPIFNKVELTMEDGKKFVIDSENNSSKNVYLDKVMINGNESSKNYIKHSVLQSGGSMKLKMSDKPNENRGVNKVDFPYSFSDEK